jgi:hypothetical protein
MTMALGLAALLLALSACAQDPAPPGRPTTSTTSAATTTAGVQWVGLRRSGYGLRAKNGDDAWWIARAQAYAASFPGATPVIVEIVSGYQDDGSTQFEFAQPKGYAGPTERMTFQKGKLNHERALTAYDQAGVKAIIQFEPGDADMIHCLEIAHAALGQHPCVIGYGIDAEWYCTKQSRDQTGLTIPDASAKAWTEKVVALNKGYVFFIKHFEASHLPPKYRDAHLWFLSDSQEFASADELMKDFKEWAAATAGSATGYQFGYPKDRKWWSKLADPPVDLGQRIARDIPSCRYLFWVDFTADAVTFEHKP